MSEGSNSKTAQLIAAALVAGLGVVAAAGCVQDFEPYSKIVDLRVLAFAPEKPALAPGESTTLSALIHSDEDVTYSWEWCPLATGPSERYECAFTQEELDQFAAESPVPFEAPPLVLGSGPTVEFTYPLPPPFFAAICEQLAGVEEVPDFVTLPTCDDGFPITLRLIVSQPDGDQIIAVKEMKLLLEPPAAVEEVNQNPTISGMRIVERGKTEDEAAPLEAGAPYAIDRDKEYVLLIDLDEEDSQAYTPAPAEDNPNPEPRRENLAARWFYEGGDFMEGETAFFYKAPTFEMVDRNIFVPPDAEDYPEEELTVWVVVRDNRGGIGWVERTLLLQ